jgi:hypothetical protein
MPRKPLKVRKTHKDTAPLQFKLRLKEALKAKLEKAAAQNKVSINMEMTDRLERSFGAREQPERITALMERIEAYLVTHADQKQSIETVMILRDRNDEIVGNITSFIAVCNEVEEQEIPPKLKPFIEKFREVASRREEEGVDG